MTMYEDYVEGDLIEIVSTNEGTTSRAKVTIGDQYEVTHVDKYATVVKLASLFGDVWVDMEDIMLVAQLERTQEEARVAQRAIEVYREIMEERKQTECILSTHTYKLNDYVLCENFGVGKVVGWDDNYQYYRVYFSKEFPDIGRDPKKIARYHGSNIPKEVLQYDPYKITHIPGFSLDRTVPTA